MECENDRTNIIIIIQREANTDSERLWDMMLDLTYYSRPEIISGIKTFDNIF